MTGSVYRLARVTLLAFCCWYVAPATASEDLQSNLHPTSREGLLTVESVLLALSQQGLRDIPPGDVPPDTPAALDERNAAAADLASAEQHVADLTTRLTALTAYEANLTSQVHRLESSVSDGNAALLSAQNQLTALRSGGSASDAVRAAVQTEVNGLVAAVQEVQNRIVALRSKQVDVLTASMDRGTEAKDLTEEQTTLRQDIRLLVRQVAALSTTREQLNATLSDAEQKLALTQVQLNSAQQAASQSEAILTRQQVAIGESVATLNQQKLDVDRAAAGLRTTNLALVAEVDVVIRRRDDLQLKRDSLRRQVALLDVVVRQLNQTLDARRADLEDVVREAGRTQQLLLQRRSDNDGLNAYIMKIKQEAAMLQETKSNLTARIPALQEQLSNLSCLRDRFSDELAQLNGNISADAAIVENLRATRTSLRQRFIDMQKEVAVRQNDVRKITLAIAAANDTDLDIASKLDELESKSSKLLTKIGNIQAQLEKAEERARYQWLERRGECQCDELRFSGAGVAEVAQCMRKCADAVVVAGAALLELSRAHTVHKSSRFVDKQLESPEQVQLTSHQHVLEAYRIDSSAQQLEQQIMLDDSHEQSSMQRFADVSEDEESSMTMFQRKLTDLRARQAKHRLEGISRALNDASSKIESVLLHDSETVPDRVSKLVTDVKASLESMDSSGATHSPQHRSIETVEASFFRFRAVEGQERVAHSSGARVDPLAAATTAKAADLNRRATLLDRDTSAKQSSVADLETKRMMLASQFEEATRRTGNVQQQVRDAEATIRGTSSFTEDSLTTALKSKRDILQNSLAALRSQADELQDRTSLMESALTAADAGLKRLQESVAEMRGARNGLRDEQTNLNRAISGLKYNSQARRRELDTAADDLKRSSETAARMQRRLEERLAELGREESAIEQYLAFMTDANSKLNAHIFELRSSKEDLVSAEVAMTAELSDTDAKLKSLLAQQAELGAVITDTSATIDITRKNLSDVSEQLLQQDTLRGQLTQDAGASALDRDKLRAEQVRYFEQVEALRRELLTTVRRLVDLNATLADARADSGEKLRLKAEMVNSLVNIQQGIDDVNGTLSMATQEGFASKELLRSVSADVEHARHLLTSKQAEVAKYGAAYQKLLSKLGRMPDVSIGKTDMDASTREAQRGMIAEKEARAQALSVADQDDIAELLGDWGTAGAVGSKAG